MSILSWIMVGLAAGLLASLIWQGYGLLEDVIVGVVGAIIGGWLFVDPVGNGCCQLRCRGDRGLYAGVCHLHPRCQIPHTRPYRDLDRRPLDLPPSYYSLYLQAVLYWGVGYRPDPADSSDNCW